MGLFAVGWPWWDCFYSQQLQICSCWFYSVFMMRPRWLSSPVAWWVLRSGNLLVGPGDRFFCPPKRYYRLFGNSCISGDSRLISCNNNYRYFAVLLFVKKSFDTIEVSGFFKKTLVSKSNFPPTFFFSRWTHQQPSPRRFPWKIRYWTALRVQFSRKFWLICLNEEHLSYPKFAIGFLLISFFPPGNRS